MINTTKEQKAAALAEEIQNIQKWVKPKTRARNVYKIEEDGTKTQATALDMNGRVVFHNEEGPALTNIEQKRKEYYLNGIEYNYKTWNEIMKGKEGLPPSKKPAPKGFTNRS